MSHSLPTRAEVAPESTWDLESIFATPADWEAAFSAADAEVPSLAAFVGKLGDPETLVQYFQVAEALQRQVSHVGVYAHLGFATDTSNTEAAARTDRAMGLGTRLGAALAFAEPELLALGAETLTQWGASHPVLSGYAHYFERLLQRAPHIRSAEVEGVLTLAGDALRSATRIHGILCDADLTFAPAEGGHEIGQSTIGSLLTDSDRAVRESAWKGYADAHLAHKNSLAQCLATGVKQNVFLARVRGYDSALHAALTPNFIPVSVFESLIEAFQKNLPTWHRYWALRKRVLGLEKLAPWDIKAPLTPGKSEVSYAQSVQWIAEGMAPLGEEYVAAMVRGATDERWVDWAVNKGKRMGAFSSGTVGTHPFIMMSYNDDVFSLSTLAHELGHSLHSYYSRRSQPQHYASYGLFVAEVASNFNQALTRAYLLEKFADNKELLIGVLEEAMSNFHRYFLVMPTLARFEREIHERVWNGQALTAQFLTQRMAELFAEAFGPDVALEGEDWNRVGSTWMQFSTHLYSNFYVYQYATGISGAHALAEGVLRDGQPAADAYLGFLKAGGSQYPLEVLKSAGVDLSSPAPVEAAFATLASYVERLETLV
ncbi:oligoendopeptidase F [Armatimonas rosea]|uniref:Oligopeptidase F n=1 Tax=Armatimonas rosea TaxID=685828 RepID=A0A7W9W817_ARMRO|nr:oligoendopeptidase F [Armatimonas rosea]MBB6052278.1 oligoendopeptidase F [Armatimonas rosea]